MVALRIKSCSPVNPRYGESYYFEIVCVCRRNTYNCCWSTASRSVTNSNADACESQRDHRYKAHAWLIISCNEKLCHVSSHLFLDDALEV